MSAGDVELKISGNVEDLVNTLDQVKGLIEGAFVVEGIERFIDSMSNLGRETLNMSVIIGISTEAVGTLSAIAEATGTSIERFGFTMTQLSRNIARAQQGSEAANNAFKALGLSATALAGMSADQRMDALATAFSRVQDGAIKSEIGMTLFGRSFMQIEPILNKGAGAFEEFRQMAERAGTALSQDTVDAMQATEDKTTELSLAVEGVLIRTFKMLEPVLNEVIDHLTKFFEAIHPEDFKAQIAEVGSAALSVFTVIGDAVLELMFLIAQLSGSWKELEATILSIGSGIVVGGMIGGPIGALIGGLTGMLTSEGMSKALGGGGNDAAMEAINTLKANFDDLSKRGVDALNNIAAAANNTTIAVKNVLTAGDVSSWKVTVTKNPALDPAQMAINDALIKAQADLEIQMANLVYASKKALIDQEVSDRQLSISEGLAENKAALQQELTDEISAINQKIAKEQEGSVAWQKLQDEKIVKTQEYYNKLQGLDIQATQEMMARWQQWLGAIGSGFNSLFSDFLHGITSWQDEWRKLMQNMLISFVGIVEQMVVKWAAGEAAKMIVSRGSETLLQTLHLTEVTQWITGEVAKTAATTTGAATRASADTAAALAGVAAQKGASMATVSNDVAAVFAGEAAFFAPLLGPGAPAAALGIASGVAGTALGMMSFETGTWSVPETGPALIHKGEMVLPVALADAVRSTGAATIGTAASSVTMTDMVRHLDVVAHVVADAPGAVIADMVRNTSTATVSIANALHHTDAAAPITASVPQTAFDTGSWEVPETAPAIVHKGEMVLPVSMADIIRHVDHVAPAGDIQAPNMTAFETGSWSVPYTGAALVHQGEMILPTAVADVVRGSGGGNIELHVHSLDVGGVKQFFESNGEHIVRALRTQARNFHPALRSVQ